MNEDNLSREYLESISTAELIALADRYGLDIPENLTRRFIIGELLEVAEELKEEEIKEDVIVTEKNVTELQDLPVSYNETKIRAILHNPAWAFVFWDMLSTITGEEQKEKPELYLHVCIFNSAEEEKPSDVFDIKAAFPCGEQYIMLPETTKAFAIELRVKKQGGPSKGETAAFTNKIEIPQERKEVLNIKPGEKPEVPPLVLLSGISELIREQHWDHRQSF